MQQVKLTGTVILSETPLTNNRPNYIIKSLIDQTQTSITKILDTIFKSKNTIDKIVEVKGVMFNTGHNFKGFGKLIIGREDYKTKVDAYFIGEFPIERQLFELLDTNIELTLIDYTDSIGEFMFTENDAMYTTEDDSHDTKSRIL